MCVCYIISQKGTELLECHNEDCAIIHDIVANHHKKINDYQSCSQKENGFLCPTLRELLVDIVAVADVYDALKSKRAYKESYTKDRVFEILELTTQRDSQLQEIKDILFYITI